MLAAKAALAANQQRKFSQMHHALLSTKRPLNQVTITQIAQRIGLNIPQFKQDMASKQTQTSIENNFALAKKLNINGTPAFIVASTYKKAMTIIPGAVPITRLTQTIKEVRDHN